MKGIQKKLNTFEIKYIDALSKANNFSKIPIANINILRHADMLGRMYTSQMESCLHEIIAKTEEKLLDLTFQTQSMEALNALHSYRVLNPGRMPFPSFVEIPDWEAVELNFQIVSAQIEKLTRAMSIYETESFEKICKEITASYAVMSVEKIPFMDFIKNSRIDVCYDSLLILFGTIAMEISSQFSIMSNALLDRAGSIHCPGWVERYKCIADVEQYPIVFIDTCSDYICEIVEEIVRYAITYSNETIKKEAIE